MTSSHIEFRASNKSDFRRALLRAVAADLAIDAAHDDELLREGKIRHTLHINGRTMGYEARINDAGHWTVTTLEVLTGRNQSRKPAALKTIDQIRAGVPSYMFVKLARGVGR